LKPGDHIQLGRTILMLSSNNAPLPKPQNVEFIDTADQPEATRIVGSMGHEPDAMLGRALADWTVSRRAAANLRILYQIGEEIARPSPRLEELLQKLLEITLPAVGADRGCMLVADTKTDRIEPRVVVRRPGLPASERFPVSRSIVQYVIQNGVAVRTSDARHDDRFNSAESILQSGIREALCAPMFGRFELLGVLYVDITTSGPEWSARSGESRFDDDHLALLAAVARQAASAVESFRYRQALIESERLAAIGHTTAVLSHHIKNILQGIRGGSYLIDLGLKDTNTSMIQKGWRIVERNQDRIYRLVMDMLTYSKERNPVLAPDQLNAQVGDVCDLMQKQAEETNVRLVRDFAVDVPVSDFDSEAIHRAILNLVVNALEAVDQVGQPQVVVSTRYDRSAERLILEVADNGPGVPPEERERIFKAFESTKGSHGTGLGLAVSRKIMLEHGGELSVHPNPGGGSIFRMSWPRMTGSASRPDDIDGSTGIS
ncbi:MAG TPA: HAMP domain-containing sensor histidine kinase, partial [Caulifigura sp.]|nr:HAMP domain-containing sensor histidine kinase [Caulifigura sp.]